MGIALPHAAKVVMSESGVAQVWFLDALLYNEKSQLDPWECEVVKQ